MPLGLATLSFAICFAAWGLISAFATTFRAQYQLSSTQTALLISVPVLLGSLARVPMGMLADRFGGRVVFTILMLGVAVPVWLLPSVDSYRALLVVAFLIGVAGASFAVGVGFVSRWTPPVSQGVALGVYGLGTIGQSAIVFLGPVIAAAAGWQAVSRGLALLLVVWAIVFGLLARNAPGAARPSSIGAMVRLLTHSGHAWALSAFYFLTFGGFVAFSIYLPTLLRDEFGLTAADAGFRAADFALLATLLRPVGGWIADRLGGARLLSIVLLGIIPFALLLEWPNMIPFTVGALGCAVLMGLGNGAVFKLVPQYFPAETGTVTGLVGAMGGLGGFFPPLLLGIFRDRLGVQWPGFLLLAVTAFLLWLLNRRVFLPADEQRSVTLPPELTRTLDRVRAGLYASLWTGLLVASIIVGSRNLQHFDAALVIYTFAVIFTTWGVAYHYHVWIRKPPTRVYWERSVQLARQEGLRAVPRMISLAGTHIFAQTFIRRRSVLRWWMHQCLFWGCLLAVAITFPLVFGWIHFETLPDDQLTYVTYLFGFPTIAFPVRSITAWLLFHGLDISAVLVLAGIALALWRRMQDRGAQAVQSFSRDMFPLVLLFAICVSGLALTLSVTWLRGAFFPFLAILHAITVVSALLFLPFGKFFHIFQRPAQLGVKLYQDVGSRGAGAVCRRCGVRYASAMHIADLKRVLPEVGFDYTARNGEWHWQDLCPACKRTALAHAQLRAQEEMGGQTGRS
jgi:NNP family nitrate/nitrite transporter-like MFS transporter